jgi:hypothetical protein
MTLCYIRRFLLHVLLGLAAGARSVSLGTMLKGATPRPTRASAKYGHTIGHGRVQRFKAFAHEAGFLWSNHFGPFTFAASPLLAAVTIFF